MMIKLYKSDANELREQEHSSKGCWISLIAPTNSEIDKVAEQFHIEAIDLKAALDEEECSRIEFEENRTLIIVDIPSELRKSGRLCFTTIPLGIIVCEDHIITICKEKNLVIDAFMNRTIKEFSTKKKMRFVYQILHRAAMVYQSNLRVIDKTRREIEARTESDTEDKDLIALHDLESAMVYFATSLQANLITIERLARGKKIELFQEDEELLEDVMIEIQQAIEMTAIYRSIINGTRELLSTIINNRMNDVMKILTSITLVMAIPTIISGIYGMNVSGQWIPLSETPFGFGIICLIMFFICLITVMILKRKKLL